MTRLFSCFCNICSMKNALFLVIISISLFCSSQEDLFTWKRSSVQLPSGYLFESALTHGYLKGRTIRVWVPKQYVRSKKRFDVVYFHDGQMLFDSSATWNHQSWDLAKAATKYLSKNRCILVGIDNDPPHRYAEFFPSPIYSSLPVSVQLTLRDSLWNGLPRFDLYSDALINEVFPLIEKQWRVNCGGAYRTMVGSSMGGIVSMSFLLNYPDEMSNIACLSMHLPLINYWQFGDRYKEPLALAYNEFVASRSANLEGKRIYVDRGDQSLDASYAAYFPAFEVALNSSSRKNKITVSFVPNSDHSERAWAARIGPILQELLK
ncbi:MAG: hypothetical protein RL432_1703 [Bacteroidota bacterium]